LLVLILAVCLFSYSALALVVSPGDRLELKASKPIGVPLHENPFPSLVGRAPDGTVASVLETADGGQWIKIQLPDGNERWIVERYVGAVSNAEGSSTPDNPTSDNPTSAASPSVADRTAGREVTVLTASPNQLTVAAINVENLDPGDDDRFAPLGSMIVNNLKSPDIVALIEIQDNDGPSDSGITTATQTYEELTQAIAASQGPRYQATDIAPQNNTDGGQPGGNIRVGFIYQPDRVQLVAQRAGTASEDVDILEGPKLSLNPGRIEPNSPAFEGSRKPLAAQFSFNGQPVFAIAAHFVSKRGDSDDQRAEQARIVSRFAQKILAQDANANVLVMGDLNDLNDSKTIRILTDGGLTDLSAMLDARDRYTYNFRGRLQQLDYILASPNLAGAAQGEFDIVHVNVNKPRPLSDHEPVLARFTLPVPVAVDRSPQPTPSSSPARANPPARASSSSTAIFPELTGEALKARLAEEFKVKNDLGYDPARAYMYSRLDNENGVVRGIYSGYEVRVNPNSPDPSNEAYQGGRGINAEHSWPQSKGATGVAKSDLHHLFPALAEVNSLRGSLPFADIPDNQTDLWIISDRKSSNIPTENIDSYSEADSDAFEPREAVKGNIARAQFYFYTLYEDQAAPGFFQKQQKTLCKWNQADPVDPAELNRSRNIALKQGNENPFVLDPTLAERTYCP